MRRKKEKQPKPSIRERAAESLGASKEIILDAPKIVFIGNREVVVENYKSIVEYTETHIVLETNPRKLRFTGRELEIKSFTSEMLFITGNLAGMEFVKEG